MAYKVDMSNNFSGLENTSLLQPEHKGICTSFPHLGDLRSLFLMSLLCLSYIPIVCYTLCVKQAWLDSSDSQVTWPVHVHVYVYVYL